MAKPWRMTPQQMQEIRRGVQLAHHDAKVVAVQLKYGGDPSGILDNWMSVYREAEKMIIGSFKLTKLTMKAYCRTMDGITAAH